MACAKKKKEIAYIMTLISPVLSRPPPMSCQANPVASWQSWRKAETMEPILSMHLRKKKLNNCRDKNNKKGLTLADVQVGFSRHCCHHCIYLHCHPWFQFHFCLNFLCLIIYVSHWKCFVFRLWPHWTHSSNNWHEYVNKQTADKHGASSKTVMQIPHHSSAPH